MRVRFLAALAALSLAVAACGSGEVTGRDADAGVRQGTEGEAMTLAYSYDPDTTLGYDFSMDMSMHGDGDFGGAAEFQNMTMAMQADGSLDFSIGDGPDAGTFEITLQPSIDNITFGEFSIDGESLADQLPASDLTALAGTEGVIPEMVVVLDEQGNILEMRSGDVTIPTEFLSGLGGGFDPTGMGTFGTLFGPTFPEEQLRIGGEWSTENTQEIPAFGSMTAVTHHKVVGAEEIGGRDTLVIESSTEIAPIELDLEDMIKAFTEMDPAAYGMSESDLAFAEFGMREFENLGITFNIAMEFPSIEVTTWFDPDAGLMVRTSGTTDMVMDMEFDSPEGSGSMSFDMSLAMIMRLTETGAAA